MIAAILRALPWATLAALYGIFGATNARVHLVAVCLSAFAIDVMRSVSERIALRTARKRALVDAMVTTTDTPAATPEERVVLLEAASRIGRLVNTNRKDTP